jgi:hypothetical protein
MKENMTEIVCILDESRSMIGLADETISGYNTFIKEQQALPGEAKLTTVLFNNKYHKLYDRLDIGSVEPLDDKKYQPEGMTALLDAIGQTIDDIGKHLAAEAEENRPSKVVFMIITDGMENVSKKYTKDQVTEKINHQKEKYSWEFIFLAKDLQTVEYASSIGIQNSVQYEESDLGTLNVYHGLSHQVSNLRGNKQVDLDELISDLKTE